MTAYLHGYLGDPAVWDGIAEPSALRVALPGHGGGPVRATWDANLDAIAGALAGHDTVVGYSLGARIALGLLARGDIARAVLISVNPGLDDAERAARRAADAAWASLVRTRGLAAFLDAWEAQPLFASQSLVAPARLAARRKRRLGLDPEQLAQSLEVMGLAEMPDYRAAVDARCTLVAGGEDPKFVAIARGLPARLVVIGGSGHDPTLEQPAALAYRIGAQPAGTTRS